MAINRIEHDAQLPQMHFLQAEGDVVAVPDAYALLSGDYQRVHDSLVIELPDGTSYFISGYFAAASPPDLVAPTGVRISADIAAQLAGPEFPGQYAQTGNEQGARPIGQIVGLEGTVTVQGAIDTKVVNARELMGVTKKQFLPRLKERYPGVRPAFQGQGKESAVTGNSLKTNILIGLLGVYLILAYQFRSYIQPLAVMLAIPTGLIGVVIGHLLLGLDISMPSLVGMASLTGIVVNNGILLVVFTKQRLQEGMTAVEAARTAAKNRFRAIILTSLTTIAGLTPLLLETSTQAQFLIPLVASLAFGLFSATVLSLFLVPVVFVIFDDLGLIQSGEAMS